MAKGRRKSTTPEAPTRAAARGQWLPISTVYVRIRTLVGSPDLAGPELKAALADGEIATMERTAHRAADSFSGARAIGQVLADG